MAGRGKQRALTTVLFTDIVGSSEVATELGDRRCRVLLTRHNELIRRELRRYGGHELDTAGDGFFARFESQTDAVRSAAAITQAVQELGIDVRAGVHTGEAEVVGRKGTISKISRTTGDLGGTMRVGVGVDAIAVGEGAVWVVVDKPSGTPVVPGA
jgi:class 3 adenylate cyclase